MNQLTLGLKTTCLHHLQRIVIKPLQHLCALRERGSSHRSRASTYAPCANLAAGLQPLENRERFQGEVGVVQILEMHVLRLAAGLECITLAAGAGGMDTEELTRLLQCRARREHRFEPGDPVAALARFAVGNALDAPAERRADRLEHLLGIRHRHAADEIHVVTRHFPASLRFAGRSLTPVHP